MTVDFDEGLDEQLQIVRNIRGVTKAFYMNQEVLDIMRKEEDTVVGMGSIPVDNTGFKEALKRDAVICIVKDPRFRPPPEPTVLFYAGTTLLGEEVFPWTAKKYDGRDDIVWLSDGFVCFTNAVPNGEQIFVLPPVPFPELNESNGCKDVISCSPAPTCDRLLREFYGMEDDCRLASVVVAFNRA